MGIILAFTFVMIALAYLRYIAKNHVPAAEGELSSPAHDFAYQKYHVDEIYDHVIVQPIYWFSKLIDIVVEKAGIGRAVDLVGEGVYDWSKTFRLLQNGSLGYYIFVMVIGVILTIAFSYIG